MTAPDLLGAALGYAAARLPVFPCRPRGKKPTTEHGFHDATTDPEIIRGWWRREPRANVAGALPAPVVVVDLDTPDAALAVEAAGCDLPATLVSTTARGSHWWYRLPAEVPSRCLAAVVPGVDLKGLGGYVMLPPSVHPTGAVYAWATGDGRAVWGEVAEAPGWLLALLARPARAKSPTPPDEWARLLAGPITEGERNETATRVAGLLFRQLPAGAGWELLRCWNRSNCSPPLPDVELAAVADSIARREAARRGVR